MILKQPLGYFPFCGGFTGCRKALPRVFSTSRRSEVVLFIVREGMLHLLYTSFAESGPSGNGRTIVVHGCSYPPNE